MRSLVVRLLVILCIVAPGVTEGFENQPERWTPARISTDVYESSPTFTPDGREMYFMRADADFDHYRILWSRCTVSGWSMPADIPFAASSDVSEADPFITADGRRLYFVSTRGDAHREDFDIWRTTRLADGSWSLPERLPAPVNSDQQELFPVRRRTASCISARGARAGTGRRYLHGQRSGTG